LHLFNIYKDADGGEGVRLLRD